MSGSKEPIGVIGTGYVGLVTAAGFAELGSEVWCIDIDEAKIEGLKNGRIPIWEPGLEELVERHRGRLHFSTDIAPALEHARLLFVAVGTPSTYSGDADLSAVNAVVAAMPASDRHALVMKSTVPVGTGATIKRLFAEQGKGFSYVSCPEFLKEGSAIKDFLEPDRVVIGDDGDGAGADVVEVARGMGLDDRIGPKFLHAGIGFGGSCFPKDVTALKQLAGNSGYHFQLLNSVIEVNELQKRRVIAKLQKHLGPLIGKRIALLGLAFKPNTDDMREAPSIVISNRLLAEGANVRGWDPVANGSNALPPEVELCETPLEAVRDADAAVIVTEWPQLNALLKPEVREAMRRPLIVDGRNLLDPAAAREAGFVYEAIGRASTAVPEVAEQL